MASQDVVRRLADRVYALMTRAAAARFVRRFDADVGGHEYLDEGIAADGNAFYEGTEPLVTELAFRRLRLSSDDVVADVGCGKGTAVLLAAKHGVARVVGVERGPELAAIARRNVAANSDRLRARQVEIQTIDVREWEVPGDLSVIFMYCPFLGDVFAAAIERLIASYDARPRPLRIVYNYPWEHARLLATGRVRAVDVRPGDLRLRPRWWTRGEVIVTYQVVDAGGTAPSLISPRRVNRRALAYWSAMNATRFRLDRPGVPTLHSDPEYASE